MWSFRIRHYAQSSKRVGVLEVNSVGGDQIAATAHPATNSDWGETYGDFYGEDTKVS